MQEASLNVDQLLSALQRKGIPLPFEIGTFIVLTAAEQALVLEATEQGMAAPPVVGMADVWLSQDGEVRVEPSRSAGSEQEACRALVVLLGDLLVRSAPGVPAMLLELVEHGPSDGEWTLMRLRDDLEASLVPLNRGALRRVLSRLLREVRREIERAPAASAPDARAVDRDLDALFGVESPEPPASTPSEPPPGLASSRPPPDYGAELHEAPELDEAPTQRRTREQLAARPKRAAARTSAAAGERAPMLINDDEPAPRLGRSRTSSDDGLDEFEHAGTGRSGGGARVGIALVVLAAALAGGYLLLGRERARSALGFTPAVGATAEGPERPQAPPKPPARRYGELRVTSSPERAQVLLFVGAGPIVVPDLPVGVAHEFVAVADGKAPSRAVVPVEAVFAQDGARRRYELALQLDEADTRRKTDDLGPTRLPQQVGAASGSLGDVRVITSPPGAKVYQLVGFTPDVRIENIALGEPLELLVYASDHALARLVVRDGDFKDQGGKLVAEIAAQLTRR